MKKNKKPSSVSSSPSLKRDIKSYLKKSKPLANIMNPTMFEPKVSNRWICYVEDNNGKCIIPTYLIKSFMRPTIRRYEPEKTYKEIQCGPNSSRIIGKSPQSPHLFVDYHKYGDVDILVYDPINPSASKILTNIIDKDITFNMRLVILGPVGDTVEEWIYKRCNIREIRFDGLEWGNDNEPSLVGVTISTSSAHIV
jgi:hypothetical protein